MKKNTRAAELSRLLSSLPCPQGLLCVQAGESIDIVAATAMWVSYDPVIIAVYLKPGTTAHKLLNDGRNFSFNTGDESQNEATLKAGSIKGTVADKMQQLKLALEPSESIDTPRVAGSAASYECRVLKVAACGDHDLFLGLVTGWSVRDGARPVVRYGSQSHAVGAALKGPKVGYPH